MNRRKILGFLATVPFIGALVKPGDGVALTSTAHPVTYLPSRLHEADLQGLVEMEIDLPVYAWVGDIVCCEKFHPICVFIETVHIGQPQDLERHLGEWQQEKPKIGQLPLPVCAQCGAEFYRAGGFFHFPEGWRFIGPNGLTFHAERA